MLGRGRRVPNKVGANSRSRLKIAASLPDGLLALSHESQEAGGKSSALLNFLHDDIEIPVEPIVRMIEGEAIRRLH